MHANIIPAISIVWLLLLHNFCSDETLTSVFLFGMLFFLMIFIPDKLIEFSDKLIQVGLVSELGPALTTYKALVDNI